MGNVYVTYGEASLDGFLTVRPDAGADICFDGKWALPFPDGSLDRIVAEAFVELLTKSELQLFFRECHRALRPGGTCLVAFGHGLYPIIRRNATLGGFLIREQKLDGLRSLGIARDSHDVALQLTKEDAACPDALPLVSVVTPSFKPKFFAQALASAFAQTYPNCEVIVSDNCPDDGVCTVVENFARVRPVTYVVNPEKMEKNTQKCFDLARGKYVKFLLDDDLLHPDCVRRMVLYFEAYGEELALVTSRRRYVDDFGNYLPDDGSTRQLAENDTIFDGRDFADRMLMNVVNLVGEYSTTMFRRRDLADNTPYFFSLNGRPYRALNDFSAWLHLLGKGDLAYLADPLSAFRIHGSQNAHTHATLRMSKFTEWYDLLHDAHAQGALQDPAKFAAARQQLARSYQHWLSLYPFESHERRELEDLIASLQGSLRPTAEASRPLSDPSL